MNYKKKEHYQTKNEKQNWQKGQSIIEVIVSVGILVIIASTTVAAVLGAFSTTRLAEEENKAAFFAQEGLEAAESMRNRGWDDPFLATDCSAGCGLSKVGNSWSFSGAFDHPDLEAKFTRVVKVESVQRLDGDQVAAGGSPDEETKKVTVSVSWGFSPTRSNIVEMSTMLTNWQESRGSPGAGAPAIDSCSQYCSVVGYTSGNCRPDYNLCWVNSEDYKPAGDEYCLGGVSADTCCCLP